MVADDGSMAVRRSPEHGGSKTFFARKTKIDRIHEDLPDSSIAFSASGETLRLGDGSVLARVVARNTGNDTTDQDMEIDSDCGFAARTVMGANLVLDQGEPDIVVQKGSEMTRVKVWNIRFSKLYFLLSAILKESLDPTEFKELLRGLLTVKKLKDSLGELKGEAQDNAKQKIDSLLADLDWRIMAKYAALDPLRRREIEQAWKFNEFARPLPGQAFVTSGSAEPHPESTVGTWVYHWGAVVMKADATDCDDVVTLEILAGAPRKDWFYMMYGSSGATSFHGVQSGTRSFGTVPTTFTMARPQQSFIQSRQELVKVELGTLVTVRGIVRSVSHVHGELEIVLELLPSQETIQVRLASFGGLDSVQEGRTLEVKGARDFGSGEHEDYAVECDKSNPGTSFKLL